MLKEEVVEREMLEGQRRGNESEGETIEAYQMMKKQVTKLQTLKQENQTGS